MKLQFVLLLLSGAFLLPISTGAQSQHSGTDPGSNTNSSGIQVSGHWTIEVRSADGEMVRRREFHNALTEEGAISLVSVFARLSGPGAWIVTAIGSSDALQPCLASDGTNVPCGIIEPETIIGYAAAAPTFQPLVVDVPDSGANAGKLVLSGSFTVMRDGDIGSVESAIGLCTPDVTLNLCPSDAINTGGGLHDFSSKTLSSPVPVANGQQVTVEVVFGFESATQVSTSG